MKSDENFGLMMLQVEQDKNIVIYKTAYLSQLMLNYHYVKTSFMFSRAYNYDVLQQAVCVPSILRSLC